MNVVQMKDGRNTKCDKCWKPILAEGESFTRGVCTYKTSVGLYAGEPEIKYFHEGCTGIAQVTWLSIYSPLEIDRTLLTLAHEWLDWKIKPTIKP